MNPDHHNHRQNFRWGSFGKNGDEDITFRFLYQISDDHLKNLLPFVLKRIDQYGPDCYRTFVDEIRYRQANNISVPDYEKPFIITHKLKLNFGVGR